MQRAAELLKDLALAQRWFLKLRIGCAASHREIGKCLAERDILFRNRLPRQRVLRFVEGGGSKDENLIRVLQLGDHTQRTG